MPSLTRKPSLGASVIFAATLVACSGDGTPVAPSSEASSASQSGGSSGGGGGAAPSSGTLTIKLTDSPFSDAKSLLVTFSEVSVHKADPGEWKTLPFASGSSWTCDLKKLNGPIDVLGVGALPTGKYTQIRLTVKSAALYFDTAASGPACASAITAPGGDSAPVEIPSGEVKLNNEFTVAGSGTTILLDFDGDQSIHQTGGGGSNGGSNGNGKGGGNGKNEGKYMMKPVVRVVSVQ